MPEVNLYPIFLHLQDRPVLIVGGGSVALRKTTGLLPTGAAVTILAPRIDPALADLPGVTLRQSPYTPDVMRATPRWTLAFAATNLPAINAAVTRDAATAAIPCCRCDEPESGDFSGGAMWQNGGVSLVVGTTGASPVLAARVRDQAAAAIDPLLPVLAQLLASWRPQVLAAVADESARRALLRRIASAEMETELRAGGIARANDRFAQWLAQANCNRNLNDSGDPLS